jgi:hypothetical protein
MGQGHRRSNPATRTPVPRCPLPCSDRTFGRHRAEFKSNSGSFLTPGIWLRRRVAGLRLQNRSPLIPSQHATHSPPLGQRRQISIAANSTRPSPSDTPSNLSSKNSENSANRSIQVPNPYMFNSVGSAIRIKSGTIWLGRRKHLSLTKWRSRMSNFSVPAVRKSFTQWQFLR